METFTTSLEWIRNFHSQFGTNGNIYKLFGMKSKQSQLVWNEMEPFTTGLEWKRNIHNLFGMKLKHSQLVWNEIEKQSQLGWIQIQTFTTSLEWNGISTKSLEPMETFTTIWNEMKTLTTCLE